MANNKIKINEIFETEILKALITNLTHRFPGNAC